MVDTESFEADSIVQTNKAREMLQKLSIQVKSGVENYWKHYEIAADLVKKQEERRRVSELVGEELARLRYELRKKDIERGTGHVPFTYSHFSLHESRM